MVLPIILPFLKEIGVQSVAMKQPLTTYAQKMAQATREAKATVVALAVIIVAWIVLGFGLSGIDVQVFQLPIWVVGGTLGVFVVSVVVAAVLRYAVLADFDLDDDGGSDGGVIPSVKDGDYE